jgi:hypothetical protein
MSGHGVGSFVGVLIRIAGAAVAVPAVEVLVGWPGLALTRGLSQRQ